MSLLLYMDEHIPRPITLGLRVRGANVLTAQEDDQTHQDDERLLDRAEELGRVMVSFDSDMLRIATARQRTGKKFAGLIFARPNRISVGECIRDLKVLAQVGEPSDLLNEIIYLPLR